MDGLFTSIGPLPLLLFLGLGALVGTIAGLFGVGGGLVIVPALIWGLPLLRLGGEHTTHLAVGTSLMTIVVTSLAAIRAHHRRGGVLWGSFWRLTPGILAGASLGGLLAGQLDGLMLQRLYGLFALMVGVHLLSRVTARRNSLAAGPLLSGLAGGVIGLVSALVGIGGGTMTVPFLNATGVEMRQAVATSSACGLPIALAGALSFIYVGWGQAGLPWGSSGYVYWPVALIIVATSSLFAPVGAALAHHLPGARLRQVFALFLLLVGGRLLLG